MCFDFLFLLWLFFLQLKHQSYAGEGSGDSDLDQDYVHIFWWSSYVCGCLSFTKNDHEKSKIRQNSIWAKITNPSWAPEAPSETLRNLKNVPTRAVSWAHDPILGFAGIVIMMMWMAMTMAMMMMFMVVVVNSFWEALNLKPPLIAGTTNSGRNQ